MCLEAAWAIGVEAAKLLLARLQRENFQTYARTAQPRQSHKLLSVTCFYTDY